MLLGAKTGQLQTHSHVFCAQNEVKCQETEDMPTETLRIQW